MPGNKLISVAVSSCLVLKEAKLLILRRRRGGTVLLAVCGNKRAEVYVVLVGEGNIF